MLDQHISTFLIGKKLKFISAKRFSKGYMWEVEKTRVHDICLRCGSRETVKAGKCTTTVREEPVREQALWLRIHKHRIYCKTCKKTFTEPVEGIWPKRKSTQRFRKFIAQSCARITDLKTVSNVYSVSHGFTYQVYYEQIETKLKEFKSQVAFPEVLGIDEHFFKRQKGKTQFVTMLTDLKKNRIFDLVEGKDHKSLQKGFEKTSGAENVKIVVMDMSSTYRSFVQKYFPNAIIVADKFHVLRLYSHLIMKEGKKIHGHRQELQTRKKLLYSRMNLDYSVRSEIDFYLRSHTKLNELYRFKEKLFELYRTKGLPRATRSYENLIKQMKESSNEGVQSVLGTLTRWKKEILAYFDCGYTNAFTERMNGTGKLVQRRAFGYKNFKNYRLRTLSACLCKTF